MKKLNSKRNSNAIAQCEINENFENKIVAKYCTF